MSIHRTIGGTHTAAVLTAGACQVAEARLAVGCEEQPVIPQQFCDSAFLPAERRKVRFFEGLRLLGPLLHAFNRPYD
jgi:hypothetical protein